MLASQLKHLLKYLHSITDGPPCTSALRSEHIHVLDSCSEGTSLPHIRNMQMGDVKQLKLQHWADVWGPTSSRNMKILSMLYLFLNRIWQLLSAANEGRLFSRLPIISST